MRDFRRVVFTLFACLRLLWWIAATVGIGALALGQVAVVASRWRRIFGGALYCARGHATSAYGVYECRCGALVEDWVFARCRVCRQSAGWTPCLTCGLPLKNPLHI